VTLPLLIVFSFHATAPTGPYTLSLHDALPIYPLHAAPQRQAALRSAADIELAGAHRGIFRPRFGELADRARQSRRRGAAHGLRRSEEHTSELQSLRHLVCRLLLEKKKGRGWQR